MRILLIGAGRFGRNHLRVLQELTAEGLVELAGVVVRTEKSRRALKKELAVPVLRQVDAKLLKSVDGVVIATPPETHEALAASCLRYNNVLVEKPLADTSKGAKRLVELSKRYGRILAVGHTFRFHPMTERLSSILPKKQRPTKIVGSFINPTSADLGRKPSFELLHLYDLIDTLLSLPIEAVWGSGEGRVEVTNIRYEGGIDARLELGWRGDEKIRTLEFSYPDRVVSADFGTGTITIKRGGKEKSVEVSGPEPLKEEVRAFIDSITARGRRSVDGGVGARIVEVAEQAVPRERAPKLAIIGGGIFGVSAALELGKQADVVLFEKNDELLQEASLVNQFRHHFGYHYPRSDETAEEARRSDESFSEVFGEAMLHSIPTFYGLPKKGSKVSRNEFIEFCKRHKLPYRQSYPPKSFFNRAGVGLCVRVPEPSYHHGTLKRTAERKLASLGRAEVRLATPVTKVELLTDGRKRLYFKEGGRVRSEEFDIVVNATYARLNEFLNWLKLPTHPIRIDVAEVLIVKLPIAPVSLTVVDGEFATLMQTGEPNEFTLYHVRESIHERYVPADGLVKGSLPLSASRRERILAESKKFFPILEHAQVKESRFAYRGVRAHREHDDSRVSDLIEHGFGCFSILSGKICSSVLVARKLATQVLRKRGKGRQR